eukprot:1890400-Rhodomonas_salina.2
MLLRCTDTGSMLLRCTDTGYAATSLQRVAAAGVAHRRPQVFYPPTRSLRAPYALPGTDIVYPPMRPLRASYTLPGTDIAYRAFPLRALRY